MSKQCIVKTTSQILIIFLNKQRLKCRFLLNFGNYFKALCGKFFVFKDEFQRLRLKCTIF